MFVGPRGSGRTTLVDAIAERLQLAGTLCVAGADAAFALRDRVGVAIIEDGSGTSTATAVLALVEAGWRVLAVVDGPSVEVDESFAALVSDGRARLVEVPALERPVREHILRRVLPGVDAAVVDLLARAAHGDGIALAVLATRTIARGALTAGGVDVEAAALALRRGQGVLSDAPPVPARVDALVTGATSVPERVQRTIAGSVRPLLVTGPLASAIADVEAGAPLAIAGGRSIGVAPRAVLHHALAGRSVLLLTACETERRAAARLAGLIDAEAMTTGIGGAVVADLPIAVLADAARSLGDVAGLVRRVRPFVGFAPDVVVVEARNLDDLADLTTMDLPVIVVADRGAALPADGWDVDDRTGHLAVRRRGGQWRRLARPTDHAAAANGFATDDTGAVRAWRLWSLIIDADGVALGSPVRNTVWPRGVLTSTCSSCGNTPRSSCTCGIYAFSDASHALAVWRHSPQLVFGELRCWGRIVRHDTGVRAQHAQPVLLHLGAVGSEVERRTLSARYGCDVVGR